MQSNSNTRHHARARFPQQPRGLTLNNSSARWHVQTLRSAHSNEFSTYPRSSTFLFEDADPPTVRGLGAWRAHDIRHAEARAAGEATVEHPSRRAWEGKRAA